MATRRTLSGPLSVDGGSQVEVRQVGRERGRQVSEAVGGGAGKGTGGRGGRDHT